MKLDEARFFFDAEVIAFISEIRQAAEKRFGLLGDRWEAYEQDEDHWAQQADQLSGTDIALRELYAERQPSSKQRFDLSKLLTFRPAYLSIAEIPPSFVTGPSLPRCPRGSLCR